MQFLVLSFSHKNVDLYLREKLSLDIYTTPLDTFKNNNNITELIALSTCNRLEMIMFVESTYMAINECLTFIEEYSNISLDILRTKVTILEGYSAIYHIFSLASGLESLIIGESEISGQLRNAYKFSISHTLCGKNLTHVIDAAFKCASSVRNNSGTSNGAVSIASVATLLLKQHTTQKEQILVVGAGEVSELLIRHLLDNNYNIILINRSIENAYKLKGTLKEEQQNNIAVQDFSRLETLINSIPIIFLATAANKAIIYESMIHRVDFNRCFFDLALPRNMYINDDFSKDNNITYFTVDDLKDISNININNRQKALDEARSLINNHVSEFYKQRNMLLVDPLIKTLRQLAKNACLRELDRAITKGFVPEEYRLNVEKVLHNSFNVFLHTPTKKIKEISNTEYIVDIERTIKKLFNLNENCVSEATKNYDKSVLTTNAKEQDKSQDKSTKKERA